MFYIMEEKLSENEIYDLAKKVTNYEKRSSFTGYVKFDGEIEGLNVYVVPRYNGWSGKVEGVEGITVDYREEIIGEVLLDKADARGLELLVHVQQTISKRKDEERENAIKKVREFLASD